MLSATTQKTPQRRAFYKGSALQSIVDFLRALIYGPWSKAPFTRIRFRLKTQLLSPF